MYSTRQVNQSRRISVDAAGGLVLSKSGCIQFHASERLLAELKDVRFPRFEASLLMKYGLGAAAKS